MSNSIGPESNPFAVFNSWMEEMKRTPGIREPAAMSVATFDGKELHSRMVLCRGWAEEGFTFYTNYNSRKGLDIAADPRASAVFYWDPVFRQVTITGEMRKTSDEVSDHYWNARARDSQLSQYISDQSKEVASREELERAWTKAEQQFEGQPIPRPAHWGGYILVPSRIEFWVGKTNRLHDRYEFQRQASGWKFRRLFP